MKEQEGMSSVPFNLVCSLNEEMYIMGMKSFPKVECAQSLKGLV
jgi:hypothetical protein